MAQNGNHNLRRAVVPDWMGCGYNMALILVSVTHKVFSYETQSVKYIRIRLCALRLNPIPTAWTKLRSIIALFIQIR
jgi:hypothetical protein